MNVRPNVDRTFFSTASLVASWDTLSQGIDQGREFLAEVKDKRRSCLVIVTGDRLAEQITNFKRLAKNWRFLDGTGIECIALLSLSQFEYAIKNRSPDALCINLMKTWDELEPLSLESDLVDHDFLEPPAKWEDEEQEYVVEKWQKLFPGLKMGTKDY